MQLTQNDLENLKILLSRTTIQGVEVSGYLEVMIKLDPQFKGYLEKLLKIHNQLNKKENGNTTNNGNNDNANENSKS